MSKCNFKSFPNVSSMRRECAEGLEPPVRGDSTKQDIRGAALQEDVHWWGGGGGLGGGGVRGLGGAVRAKRVWGGGSPV